VGKKVLALLGYIFDILLDVRKGFVASKQQVVFDLYTSKASNN
jgi:hypothetical protein